MAGRLRTPLCKMLDIEYPIVLAGMAVGGREQHNAPTPVELVAAVSNAGGLGFLGNNFRYDPDKMDAGIKKLKLLTDRPFGVNFLLPARRTEVRATSTSQLYKQVEQDYPDHIALVKKIIRKLNLPDVEVPEDAPLSTKIIERQIEVILDNRVPVFAAALGDPGIMTKRAHAQGMKVIGMVGAVRHVRHHVAANVDIITAQGTEAGGHTGNIASFVLTPQIVKAAGSRPVLTAGGVGSGKHVAAALALGAQGVWVGTAFLASKESNIPEAHRSQILGGASEEFTLSKSDTGKQQRGYWNLVKTAWKKSGLEPLPMPLQGVLMSRLNRAAQQADRWDLIRNPSGQIGGTITTIRPARDILMDLVNEAEETIEMLQYNLGSTRKVDIGDR